MMDIDSAKVQQNKNPIAQKNVNKKDQTWTLFIDWSLTKDGSGVGIVLKSPKGTVIEQSIQLGFIASNNEAEYKALIVGLKKEMILGVQNLVIHCDSQLVANQLIGEYVTRIQNDGG